MPILVVLVLLLVLSIAFVALVVPFSMFQRYRAGTARRRARWWILSLNLYAAVVSSSILLGTAAISSFWIPNAFPYTAAGWLGGGLLGLLGLLSSSWEKGEGSLHYTPNRLLILLITVLVSARIFYGFWRTWNAWQTTEGTAEWLAESGAAGSMAAGAVVLGYYVAYWIGLRWRLNRHLR